VASASAARVGVPLKRNAVLQITRRLKVFFFMGKSLPNHGAMAIAGSVNINVNNFHRKIFLLI
jgi:hypothetical protein